jgi:hypothetical protein
MTDSRSTISLLAAAAILSAILGFSYGATFNGASAVIKDAPFGYVGWWLSRHRLDPAQTSQRCSACQAVDAASRISRSRFVCTNCGSLFDADINAARNMLAIGVTGGFPGLARDRAGLPAGSRKRRPRRRTLGPFRAESSHLERIRIAERALAV